MRTKRCGAPWGTERETGAERAPTGRRRLPRSTTEPRAPARTRRGPQDTLPCSSCVQRPVWITKPAARSLAPPRPAPGLLLARTPFPGVPPPPCSPPPHAPEEQQQQGGGRQVLPEREGRQLEGGDDRDAQADGHAVQELGGGGEGPNRAQRPDLHGGTPASEHTHARTHIHALTHTRVHACAHTCTPTHLPPKPTMSYRKLVNQYVP